MTLSTIRPAVRAISGEEHVDVVQIRLWNADSAMALVGEFRCADRVLADWGRSSGRDPVRFEVRFADDYVVRGAHEFFRNGKRRCLLTTHVRRLLSRSDTSPGPELVQRAQDRARYLIPR
jgi:hypothetical protein